MWDAIKNLVTNAKEALGIEIPGLPEGLPDLGGIGEAVTGAVQGVGESAGAAVESVTAAGGAALGDGLEAASGLPAQATEQVAQGLPNVAETLGGAAR